MRAASHALILHLLLAASAAAALRWLHAPMLGLGVLGLVVGYNLLLPALANRAGHYDWLDIWGFLLPLSVFQVVPDWVLSQLLGILVFPDLGAPRLGTVPVYMAGMWVIPLFWILWLAGRSLALSSLLALLVFGAAEWAAPLLRLWQPQHVAQSYGIAHYVLLPEALLGWAAAFAFREVQGRAFPVRVAAAAAVSVFYTGALVVAYFLGERAGWHLG